METLLTILRKINNRVDFLSENREGSAAMMCIKDHSWKLFRISNGLSNIAKAQADYIEQLEAHCANKWMQSRTFNACRVSIIEAKRAAELQFLAPIKKEIEGC